MSVKILDKKNPIALLENFNITHSKGVVSKKSIEKICNDENAFNCLSNFYTLFKNKSDLKEWESFIHVHSPSNIIHSIVGLFDVCLPDMDIDTIYNSTVNKEAYTIFMFSSQDIALERLKKKMTLVADKEKKLKKIIESLKQEKFTECLTDDKDIYVTASDDEDDFKLVYDDFESECEDEKTNSCEEEESSSDEDFSIGYNSYIRSVYQRKLRNLEKEPSEINEIGFEDQLIGAISFKIRYVELRKIVHVTLLGVHKSYRGAGVGSHLVNLVLNQAIVGQFDAVVVHADWSACEFFKKFGFSDDSLLNTQWYTLEPEYTNCSLLTFVQPYSGNNRHNEAVSEEFSTAEMEVDIKLWQKKAIELHCFQYQTFQRMKMEIAHLKGVIKNQDKMMKVIMGQLRDNNKEKLRYERFLKNKIEHNEKNVSEDLHLITESDDDIITKCYKHDDNIESKIKDHFNESLRLDGQLNDIRYLSFTRSKPSSIINAEYQATKKSIEIFNSKSCASPHVLYFCEPFSLSADWKTKILSEGFTKNHRKPGSHGYGLYFSTNPKIAALFSKTSTLIVAEVMLGKVYNHSFGIKPCIEDAPNGYNSVMVTMSHLQQTNNSATEVTEQNVAPQSCLAGQEYVIFDAAQTLPLGLISYRISDS